jgi:hypothetical protein
VMSLFAMAKSCRVLRGSLSLAPQHEVNDNPLSTPP